MSREPLAGRDAYRHWTRVQTRWADNDVYGHVNNTVYYQWFDLAVNAWLIEQGLLDIEQGDPIGLVVESSCSYAAPLAFPQEVDVGLLCARLGTSSVTYQLGVFARGAGEAAAQGQFTQVYVGRESRRPATLPDVWREKISAIS